MFHAIILALAAQLSHCSFSASGAALTGTCSPIQGETPEIVVEKGALAHGYWRADFPPRAVWAGHIAADRTKTFVQIETYAADWGILRSDLFGWFPVTNLTPSSNGLEFDVDFDKEIPPNDLDRKIIKRASAILSSVALWNRADNRKCPASATTWSMYCAMEKASLEITGGFDHRRPALELVRTIVEKRSEGRDYPHRLMGYNNDPSTTLPDVRSVFDEALRDSGDRAWLASHGFTVAAPFF